MSQLQVFLLFFSLLGTGLVPAQDSGSGTPDVKELGLPGHPGVVVLDVPPLTAVGAPATVELVARRPATTIPVAVVVALQLSGTGVVRPGVVGVPF